MKHSAVSMTSGFTNAQHNMVKLGLFAALLSLTPAVTSADDDLTATIRKEAEKCAKALQEADYDKVATSTHPRVIKMLGGKDAMITVLKRELENMKSKGITFEKATIGDPDKPQKVGTWTVSFVPQSINLKVPDGTVEQDSHLLGISEDDGKTWTFIDTSSLTKAQLKTIFSELAGKIELPAKKKPFLKKAE